MKRIKIILDIRTEDVDGNNIPFKNTLTYVMKALNKIWNIESYDIKNLNGTEIKECAEINDKLI